jgi:uncharacterized RDD family membrane protein YckC
MKCPKCHYLGFETSDRCKNCGYDFSLVPIDLDLKPREDESAHRSALPDPEIDRLPPVSPERSAPAAPLPLFSPDSADDDQPLVKLPVAPRPPLAVRRTPDMPRARHVRSMPREVEPVLQFAEAPSAEPQTPRARIVNEGRPASPVTARASAPSTPPAASGPMPRVLAALIDHAILLMIDTAVVYFTLRIAALPMAEWWLLPPVPMVAFLALLKLGYFCAFTTIGGQTIGKMAMGIRVVTDDDRSMDPARAVRRTLAGTLSFVTLGAGFLPALLGAERLAIHDRLAHTRVVALPS